MAQTPSISDVETTEDFFHVRYRDPDEFDEIRTPDWAENAASSVADGSEVRTGDREGDEDWLVQSVLVPVDVAENEDDARELADEIVAKIRE
ncbi:hypothetical protein BV210_09545 [Halorientalis sp. IM1011]|uniref:hypothetical protein n=1 Tax=Halorientalis sp. IM1011 TaxID=1932360 RepID=UPI00097CD01D|nr:hypothetical protein [Halorientalis sp. IM1011]AQL42943.1 hypothetical protein BV210_09545 [Halorientalis sp. IM1011]